VAKGFFAQCVVVLFEGKAKIGDLRQALQGPFTIVKEDDPDGPWEFSGPSLLVEYRPEMNGYVSVDIVHERWPDHMGDPKTESTLFGAWSMGFFGPHAYPRGLQRATQQAWSWQEAGNTVERHASFVRLRLSYAFGAPDDAPALPPGIDCRDELAFLCRLAIAVLRVPGALCYLNPGGEVLSSANTLAESLEFSAQQGLPPLDVLCNVRLFNLDPQWLVMDSVGNGQLDIPDIEVGFPKAVHEPGLIDPFIRNLTLYVLEYPQALEDGHTVDGPDGSTWRISLLDQGLVDPPRQIVRCLPAHESDVPEELGGK